MVVQLFQHVLRRYPLLLRLRKISTKKSSYTEASFYLHIIFNFFNYNFCLLLIAGLPNQLSKMGQSKEKKKEHI